jgi:hypothetical protein
LTCKESLQNGGMTQVTKIILRELAIIHTMQYVIIRQQDAILRNQEQGTGPRVPTAYTEAQLAETINLMKQRLAAKHNLPNADF